MISLDELSREKEWVGEKRVVVGVGGGEGLFVLRGGRG